MFKSVSLSTHKLKEMEYFYTAILEIPLIDSTDDYFIIQIGDSTLTFKHSNHPATYHFAFNIAGNLVKPAKNWLKGRVELNREDEKDEIYYSSFDADAIYFEDPAGNVVEFIGRRKMKVDGHFSSTSLLDISEVSITTPFVEETANKLREIGISSRNNNSIQPDSLNFLGKDDTYIILVPPHRRWYFSEKLSETHSLEIEINNKQRIAVDFEGTVRII